MNNIIFKISLGKKVLECREKVFSLGINISLLKCQLNTPSFFSLFFHIMKTYFQLSYCSKNCIYVPNWAQLISVIPFDIFYKSRDITLPTKVRLVKAMVFPVVMYGCESLVVQWLRICLPMQGTWV